MALLSGSILALKTDTFEAHAGKSYSMALKFAKKNDIKLIVSIATPNTAQRKLNPF